MGVELVYLKYLGAIAGRVTLSEVKIFKASIPFETLDSNNRRIRVMNHVMRLLVGIN